MSAQLVIFHVPIFRFLNPFGMFLGGSVVALVFMGSVWAGENKAIVKNFKKKNPTLFVVGVMVTSYFVLSLFGGVLVFIFGITFPLLCKCQCIPQDHSPVYIQISCVFFFTILFQSVYMSSLVWRLYLPVGSQCKENNSLSLLSTSS